MTQAEASRINGAKSHGPVTDEGKAASGQNSRTHGLSGGPVVLPHESQTEYDALRASFLKRFRPADEIELDLVQEMLDSRWRLRRISAMETALIQETIKTQGEAFGEDVDFETVQQTAYAALAENSKGIRLLNRYAKDLRRSYEKALKELKEIQNSDSSVVPETQSETDLSNLRNEPKFRNDAFLNAIKPYVEKQQQVLDHPTPKLKQAS